MANFISNNTALPYPKTDNQPLASGADPTKNVVAADWNSVCQALADIRSFFGGGLINFTGSIGEAGYTFASLTGSNNDVDLWSGGPRTTFVEVDITGTGATITGITAGTFGDVLFLWCGGGASNPNQLTLVSQSASSAANNRIWINNGKKVNISNNDGVILIYVGNSWICWGNQGYYRANELSIEPVTRPTALGNGTTTNDHDPWNGNPWGGVTGASTSAIFQDTGATSTITGLVAPGAPNAEGRVVVFSNISATGTITIKHNSGNSYVANRFMCPGGVDFSLGPLRTATLIYDLSAGVWRFMGVA